MEFRFNEEKNVVVFTTKHVLNGDPILYVYHNDDGYWQFHAIADPKVEDAKILLLEELIKLDPSLNELYDLPMGKNAWRADVQSEWQYS